jgi:hypothetical protein
MKKRKTDEINNQLDTNSEKRFSKLRYPILGLAVLCSILLFAVSIKLGSTVFHSGTAFYVAVIYASSLDLKIVATKTFLLF